MSRSVFNSLTALRQLQDWRRAPDLLWVVGGIGSGLGLLLDSRSFAFSWLVGFLFWLSLALGALFLVMMHHLFDAAWSVTLRRLCEHLACLVFPGLAIFFLPLLFLAPELYAWMGPARAHDPAVLAKWPFLTRPGWILASVLCFAAWGWLAHRLRHWSHEQDRTGAARCTHRMRRLSAGGIFLFALTLTLAAILWEQSLAYHWYSTIYGIYFFAGSVWAALATVYLLVLVLQRTGHMARWFGRSQLYYLGTLLFAFTVFYAYIHFSQYFVIWNANIPAENYWYVLRERGTWWDIGLLLIFGHFFVPFLALLRIDVKLELRWMAPLCLWVGLMQYVDLAFNVLPVQHAGGYPWKWLWLQAACLAFMGGWLAKWFLRDFNRHPRIPVKDPRLGEALGVWIEPVSPAETGPTVSEPAP